MQIRNALVTGAAARLGRAMALALGEQGFNVAVHYASDEAGANEVVALLQGMGRHAVALQADLLDEDATHALLPAAAKALGGPITVLVNNASIFEYDNVEIATRESWDRNFGTNLRAPFILTQALAAQAPEPSIDHMGEPKAEAMIVNMIDQCVRKLTPNFMTYTLAKAALWTLTQTAARALTSHVRVNGIGPGPTLQAAFQSDAHFAAQRAGTVTKRGSNTEDITGALLYFLNAPAVTGQLLCVDGGQHLGWKTPDIIGLEIRDKS